MWEGPQGWKGKGLDYSWLGLHARVSAGSTCHPPVKDEELEGSSVSPGQGISDTAAGSSGPVPTACMCQGPVGASQGWGASANVYGRADEGGVRRIRWRQSLLGKGWFLKF